MKNFSKSIIAQIGLVSFLSIFVLGTFLAPTTSFALDSDVASANAGPDQTITPPTSTTTLYGSSTGVSGIVLYYSWTKLSGSGTIISPTQATTNITDLTSGTSVFRLTVTNNTGTSVSDDVNIFVNGLGGGGTGSGATVDAGPDQTLYYPTDYTNLSGSSTGISGITLYYSWTLISGSAVFGSPNQASTSVTRLSTGDNIIRLTVTNNTGTTAYDDVKITILQIGPNLNIPPIAYAGPDQIITSPASSVILTGSGTDQDGSVVSYVWTKLSGSGVINIGTGSSNGSVVSITGLTVGTSVFRLTVTDNLGDIGIDDVTVVVNSSGTGGGGTGGGGTGGTGGGSGSGGTGGGGGSGGGMLCPFGITGTPATCVLISIPTNGVKKTSSLTVIKDFQKFLNWSLGSKMVPLVVDGKWGKKTTAGIKLYQRLNGLKVDGSFGRLSAGKAILILKNANLYRQ